MFLKNVELVYGIPIRIAVGCAAGMGSGDQAEGEATLALIVNRTQAHFVIAFGNGPVVGKFGDVDEVISIHATTA